MVAEVMRSMASLQSSVAGDTEYQLSAVSQVRLNSELDLATGALPSPTMELHFLARGGQKPSVKSFTATSHTILCHGGWYEATLPHPQLLEPKWKSLVEKMVQSAALGNDLCLIGPKGEGKSYVSRQVL